MDLTKKYSIKRIKHLILSTLFVALSWVALPSCDTIFDDEGDCNPYFYLQFVFERNMYYNDDYQVGADAFPAQVSSVDVYVFKAATGEFVAHFEDKGEALRQPDYRLPMLIDPGEYEIIAWCGLADNEGHFTVPATVSNSTELKCRMARSVDDEGITFSQSNLHALFHGRLFHEYPDEEGEHYATCYLTKDTNYIQLDVQHHAGELDPKRFIITLDDCNGYLAHDNDVLEDETIQYRPWATRSGYVDDDWEGRAVPEPDDYNTHYLVAELATSRLTKNSKARLTVTDLEAERVVFSIPLVDYLLMMKSKRYAALDDQEYLDREDEYNIMVLLENQDDEGWVAVKLVINGWHLTDNGNIPLQ
ncbi:MAG: FimB/Mfa2 family fimbrial subunit [Muribaculaceae bacterium]|nr:FimB/Mfa2 family fimbrial subunit [Muribaculaceae bacterium]